MNCKAFVILMSMIALSTAVVCVPYPNRVSNHSGWMGDASRSSLESFINCTGNHQSIMINNWLLFQDTVINFQYKPVGAPSSRAFASTSTLANATNSMFSDGRGTGVMYIIQYNNTDALIIEEIRMYPSLNAMLLNASLIPRTNFNFSGSEVDLVSCDRSNVLPFMDPAKKWLSYFDDVNIWGSYRAKSVQHDNVSLARTPVLIQNTTLGMLIGAVTSDRFETEVMLNGSSFAIKSPIVEGYQAYNHSAIPLETCWVQLGNNFSKLFMSYGQQVQFFNPTVRKRTVDNFFATSAGYCDWPNRYGNINETTVSHDLDAVISLHDSGYSFYTMDSGWGYNDTTGDDYNWSTWNAQKFPHGVAGLVTKAHDAGLKFVLWNRIAFAPRWVQQNRYWWVASWNGYVVMNLTDPQVQSYIANVFATWAAEGIDGIKVDFIMDSVAYGWNAAIWNAGETRAQLVNQYLDLLDRDASKYNISVLLCGTPFGYPSLARYPNLVASRVTGDSGYEGMHPDWQITTGLLRSFWWNVAFNTPDPDAYKTSDMRSLLVVSATGGALYYGENYPGLNLNNAGLAWTLHWDAPAVPDNIAFNGTFIVARGTWHGYQAVIAVNLDQVSSHQYIIDGLLDGLSAIKIMTPVDGLFAGSTCTEGGINSQYSLSLKPGYSEMLIFYNGQPPLPAQSCVEIAAVQLIVLLFIPVALLGITLMVHFRRSHFKHKRNASIERISSF
ncbi:MAG TPA: hypothetical protein VKM55_29260 [Candidatus Lokiarchaeia archaeon]|nr:hypothetical protein [Candidatus Lokiarchaeia archaeon]